MLDVKNSCLVRSLLTDKHSSVGGVMCRTILFIFTMFWLIPSYSSEMDVQHQEWTSAIYFDEPDNFVATTELTGRYGNITFYLGRTTENCDMWDVSLTLMDKHIATQAFESEQMEGRLRVDANSLHTLYYQVLFEEDEAAFFVDLIEPANKDKILREIQQGERLRLKLTINDREYVFGFPLQGAQEAIKRTKLLCVRHIKPDKDYFSGRPKNMPDEPIML
jgi:hypothetical protein